MTNTPSKLEALVLEGINIPSSPWRAFGYFEVLDDEVMTYTRSGPAVRDVDKLLDFFNSANSSNTPTSWDVDKLLDAVGKHASFYLPSDFPPARTQRPNVPFGDIGRAMIPLVRQYGNYHEPLKKHFGAPSRMPDKSADDLSRVAICDYLQNGLPQLLLDTRDFAAKANGYLLSKAEHVPENAESYSRILNRLSKFFSFKKGEESHPRKTAGLGLYGIRSEYGGSPAMRLEVDRTRGGVTIYAKTDSLTAGEKRSDPILTLGWDADRLLRNVERYSGVLMSSQEEKTEVFHLDSRDIGRLLVGHVDEYNDRQEPLKKCAGAPSGMPPALANYIYKTSLDDYLKNGLPWLSRLAEDRLTAANDFLREAGPIQDHLRRLPEIIEVNDYLRTDAA